MRLFDTFAQLHLLANFGLSYALDFEFREKISWTIKFTWKLPLDYTRLRISYNMTSPLVRSVKILLAKYGSKVYS